MKDLIAPGLLIALAVAIVLALGLRDKWLFLGRGDHREARRAKRSDAAYKYVATARVGRFEAYRKRIGYQPSNAILSSLADRVDRDPRFVVSRTGRTSIEFAVKAESDDEAVAALTQLRGALEQRVVVDQIEFDPLVSIGASRAPLRKDPGGQFDLSAWAAEDAGAHPDRINLVSASQHADQIAQSSRMLPDLIRAVNAGKLELHYLPKMRLSDSEIIGAEALCRWHHPRHGWVPPSEFIGLAEETGLINSLTLWTLDRAISDQKRLAEQGISLQIDINLSGVLVSDAAFCDVILNRIGQAAGAIGLEITETSVIEDPAAGLANLRRFADQGIHLAIDDFGAGLSSLSYLRDLPAHELKIDQIFVRSLTTSNRDPLLVRSAIEIARALEMEVTAEGVEDEMALRLLSVMRCSNVQGFHISQPLPLEELAQFLTNRATPDAKELDEPVQQQRLAS